MKIHPSRRLFLRKTAFATTGIAMLSSNSILNAFSLHESPFMGYNAYAEEKTDLRTSSFSGKHITVQGKIYDKTGLFSMPNTTVEVWHLSPGSSKYRHQGKMKTNETGEYHFITDFPNKEEGKASRVYFKVSTNETTYFTELLLNDFDAHFTGKHWEENNQLGENLFPIKEGSKNSSTITFNISI
ncbi:hypothetical protein [Lutibacter sp.]|uniref:hypothetical protein n=1 Tax=Lutibacter sp. TaxID=1925666 RepID=UPI003566DB06